MSFLSATQIFLFENFAFKISTQIFENKYVELKNIEIFFTISTIEYETSNSIEIEQNNSENLTIVKLKSRNDRIILIQKSLQYDLMKNFYV